jgi:hypothetical protein
MYAARINNNGIVTQVICGTSQWATDLLGGVWHESNVKVGVGWTYHADGFRPPQPYPSWVWSDGWQAPVPYPNNGGDYTWNKDTLEWDAIPMPDEDDGA